MGKKQKTEYEEYREKWVDLSETTLDFQSENDFLIDVALLMKDNDEYQYLLKEKNYGREEKSEDQKEINDADNIFTVKHYMRDNLVAIKKNRTLQKEIKVKLDRLKKIVEDGTTEWAQLQMLELQINDMLSEDNKE